MALRISGCGCVSDPQRMLFVPCEDRVSHRNPAPGYLLGKRLDCADCGAEMLFDRAAVVAEPCCPRCISRRYKLDRAQREAFYLRAVAAELVRLARENRGESMHELAPAAFALTPIGDAPVDEDTEPNASETRAVISLARAELLP